MNYDKLASMAVNLIIAGFNKESAIIKIIDDFFISEGKLIDKDILESHYLLKLFNK